MYYNYIVSKDEAGTSLINVGKLHWNCNKNYGAGYIITVEQNIESFDKRDVAVKKVVNF